MVKISLITATYNAADTVADSLRSAAMQTYQNVEHIVIDGASTDGTQKIVEESGERLTTFVSEPDRGIYDALNKGIALATGDVIGRSEEHTSELQSLMRISYAVFLLKT